MLTKVFEKILTMTILLGIPSKILGGLLGIIENYIIVFIALYFMSLPMFNLNLNDTKLAKFMLNNTPVISNVCSKTIDVTNDVNDLKMQYKDINDLSSINDEAIELFIKYDIISQDNVDYLKEHHKL